MNRLFQILLIASVSSFASAQVPIGPGSLFLGDECSKNGFNEQICELIIEQVDEMLVNDVSPENATRNLKSKVKDYVFSPDFLNEKLINSAVVKSSLADKPLSLEFKTVDVKDSDQSIIGLEFEYEYSFKFDNVDETYKKFDLTFKAEGFITQDAEENPRNLIEAKLTLAGFSHTAFSQVPKNFGAQLTELAIKGASGDDDAARKAYAMLDDSVAPYGGFYFLKYGLDAGLESDQELDAKNQIVSGFVYGQYDFWDRNSFLGSLGVTVGARLALDRIDPNAETPRAIAGDQSSYYRASGEIAVAVPLGKYGDFPIDLIFNYRTHQELDPSEIVETKGLDNYHLRTWALRGPFGMYVSYGSGSLPFDLSSEETVELGIKWYL